MLSLTGKFGDAGFIERAGAFIAVHLAAVALREQIPYVRILQSGLHYELEQTSKSEILRKLKRRSGGKNQP